jgi:hypothetical protein
MRKLVIAALALVGVIAAVGVAVAANTYTVNVATSSPLAKGSPSKPVPKGFKFGYTVAESDPSKRATPIEKFQIAWEGLIANPKYFPSCKFDRLNDSSVPASCNKALVGTGLVKNAAGPTSNQALAASTPCNLRLRLFNTGTSLAIRIDSDGKPPPLSFESNTIGCLLPIGTALNTRLKRTTVAGKPASDLVFSVPSNLKHPIPGNDNSIRFTTASVKRLAKRARVGGRTRTVGIYEAIGCKGSTRTLRTKFTTEATATAPAQSFTATKTSRC